MPVDSFKTLSFDTGIERILQSIPKESSRLPGSNTQLLPSDVGIDHHLEKVFTAKSLDEHLLDSLKPSLHDRELFIPSQYKSMLSDTIDSLKMASSQKNLTAADRDSLYQAAKLVEEDKDLISLLSMYRNLLLKA